MNAYLPSSTLALAFEHLSEALSVLNQRIESEPPLCFLYRTEGLDPVRALTASLIDFWHAEDDEDGRNTPVWPGLVAANPSLRSCAAAVNAAKEELTAAIGQLWMEAKPNWRQKALLLEQHQALFVHRERRERMRRVNLGRLSAKAACRQIVLVDEPATRATFTWTRMTRSFRPYTVDFARNRLLKDHPDDSLLVKKLAALPDNEILVKVQLQPAHLRANLWLTSGRVLTRRAQLPLFLPQRQLPEFSLPEPRPPEHDEAPPARGQRSDRLLQDEPYIADLQLYRYRAPRYQKNKGR